MLINICQQCGCEFERDRRRKFCSLEHAYEFRTGKPQDPKFVSRRAAAMKGIKKSPEHVDKMRVITKSKWDNGEYSRERLFTEEHKRNLKIAARKREDEKREKDGRVKKVKSTWPPSMWTQVDIKPLIWMDCPCGENFLQKERGQKYCSFECSCKFKELFTKEHKESLSINAQRKSEAAKVEFICPECGKKIIIRGSDARKRKYCSDCAIAVRARSNAERSRSKEMLNLNSERMKGKNNPAFTHPETFKYKGCRYYDDLGLRLRSGWEANVARIIRAMGYEFEYESKTFLLSDGTTYTPDFYIPEIDELIEVKGRWIRDSKKKVDRFIKEYPGLNFNLIGPVEYKGLVREFSQVIRSN